MAGFLKYILLLALIAFSLVSSMPRPGGGHGGHHTHFIIKVPHLIHEHHHTHVKKIYIPVKSHDGGHDHEHFEDSW